MLPGTVTISLFQFVGIRNNFFLPLVMLTDPDLFPITLGLYQWSTRVTQFPDYSPRVITGSLIVPQRQWRSGLATGSLR
jgi:multiple sugar transport system permease protein